MRLYMRFTSKIVPFASKSLIFIIQIMNMHIYLTQAVLFRYVLFSQGRGIYPTNKRKQIKQLLTLY